MMLMMSMMIIIIKGTISDRHNCTISLLKEKHLPFFLTFREFFPWMEKTTVLRPHRMKSDEKHFFIKFYAIFEKQWYML